MVWIPRVDEIPLSFSLISKDRLAFTVREVGEATKALGAKKAGDLIGVRGPYGSHFEDVKEKVIVVVGGCGIAPLIPYIENSKSTKKVIVGARTKDQLVFKNRLGKVKDLTICTDDGTFGEQGFVTQQLEKIDLKKYDRVYTCGPEVMMHKVFELCKGKIKLFASLERWMKCGVGGCGSCVLDPLGLRVCKDGPVFDDKILEKTTDFGMYGKDASGKKTPIVELCER
jgi:dihydroorotate dehydrogenase electron transfer subunit